MSPAETDDLSDYLLLPKIEQDSREWKPRPMVDVLHKEEALHSARSIELFSAGNFDIMPLRNFNIDIIDF